MQKPFEYAEKLAQLQLIVAALAVLALLLTISLDVILRATVNAPFSATIEIVSFYYMIPIVFFPIMFLEVSDGHIETDLFFRLFPQRMKQFSYAIAGILTIGIYSLLTYVTLKQAISSTQAREVSMGVSLLPIWPARWVLPVVFSSSAVAALILSIKHIMNGTDDD